MTSERLKDDIGWLPEIWKDGKADNIVLKDLSVQILRFPKP